MKPANVLLDEAGRAYLADFGIARMLEGSSVATATGLIQGTPSYMAPEQAMGEKVDRLADVYALGVVAFECLTGRVPYTGTTPVAILMKHVQEPVPEPTAAEVAPPLAAVLRRCLAKTPAERWPSAGAFAAALDAGRGGRDAGASLESLPTLEVPRDAGSRRAGDGDASAGRARRRARRLDGTWPGPRPERVAGLAVLAAVAGAASRPGSSYGSRPAADERVSESRPPRRRPATAAGVDSARLRPARPTPSRPPWRRRCSQLRVEAKRNRTMHEEGRAMTRRILRWHDRKTVTGGSG